MKKNKLPTINKKNFPYKLSMIYWEDVVGDSGWAEIPDIKDSTTALCCSLGYIVFSNNKKTVVMSDFIFEDNGTIKTGGSYVTIPTINILKIKKIKI